MQRWALLRTRLSPCEWNMRCMPWGFVGVTLEGSTLILEAWALGRRDAGRKKLSRSWSEFTSCFSPHSGGAGQGFDLLGELSLGWVLAGWIWGVLGTLQQTVCPVSSPSYQQCAGCSPSLKQPGEPLLWSLVHVQHLVCAPAALWLPWHSSWELLGTELLLGRELAQHPDRAALKKIYIYSFMKSFVALLLGA